MATELAQPETAAEEERRTSYLELFFDLVFVFAITQVTSLILEDSSAAGFARAALLLGLVWWAWSGYAWMTNAIEIESLHVRLLFLGGMGGAFFMALAVPGAFGDEGLWFAIPYLGVRVLQVGLYLWGVRGDAVMTAAIKNLAPWFLVAPTVVLIGGFMDGRVRTTLWAVSLAIDVAGTLTVGRAGFRVSPGHFAERNALFVIIALGESVVAIGVGAAALERDAIFAVSVAVASVGVAVLWWAYFEFTAVAAERALRFAPAEKRGPLARDVFTFFHYPLVLGVIFYAVGAKKALAHPEVPLSTAGRWALGLGAALFLSGFVLARFRVVRRVAWERVAGGLGAIVAVALLRDIDAVALLAVVIGIVLVVIAVESRRLRELRAYVKAG